MDLNTEDGSTSSDPKLKPAQGMSTWQA